MPTLLSSNERKKRSSVNIKSYLCPTPFRVPGHTVTYNKPVQIQTVDNDNHKVVKVKMQSVSCNSSGDSAIINVKL